MSKKRTYRQPAQTNPATARYIAWMRLTHNGRRTPEHPACSQCGAKMTAGDVAAYQALQP